MCTPSKYEHLFSSFVIGFFMTVFGLLGLCYLIYMFIHAPLISSIFLGIPIVVGIICAYISYKGDKNG